MKRKFARIIQIQEVAFPELRPVNKNTNKPRVASIVAYKPTTTTRRPVAERLGKKTTPSPPLKRPRATVPTETLRVASVRLTKMEPSTSRVVATPLKIEPISPVSEEPEEVGSESEEPQIIVSLPREYSSIGKASTPAEPTGAVADLPVAEPEPAQPVPPVSSPAQPSRPAEIERELQTILELAADVGRRLDSAELMVGDARRVMGALRNAITQLMERRP